jgi:flavin-dependent dehydrogenase
VDGTLAVLPRQQLDHLLVQGAQRVGAQLCTPVRLDGLIEEAGRVVGARLRTLGPTSPDQGTLQEVRARWVVLATGAPVQAMQIAGLNQRRAPSGVALRGYVRNPQRRAQQLTMDVVWHKALRPGYGWIFPVGDDVYNIGVGAFHRSHPHGETNNLRQMFEAFTSVYAPAHALMQGGELLGDLKGAPLRCTLDGAGYSRAGLLATGEAIGSTYDFTGEGIGKAMETGLLAAEVLLAGWSGPGDNEAAMRADYATRLQRLKPRFDLYAKANRINRHPWLADLVIRRARKSEKLRRRISGVLNETSNPGHLLTLQGMLRLFT